MEWHTFEKDFDKNGSVLSEIFIFGQGISCKYYPTCSCYAVEAIERFGALKGTGLAIWRVLRCNPFSQGGYDPVPPEKDKHIRYYKRRN